MQTDINEGGHEEILGTMVIVITLIMIMLFTYIYIHTDG